MKQRLIQGKTFVASVLEPIIPSKAWVICYPGSGEATGTPDGSSLSKIHYGFPSTLELPFNVMTVQTLGLNNNFYYMWQELMKFVDDNADSATIIGWSLGGREVMDMVLGFKGRKLSNKIKLAVTIDGPASGTPDYTLPTIPVIMVTGKAGMFYYPLMHSRDSMQLNKNPVVFVDLPGMNHQQLMQTVYDGVSSTSVTILKALLPLEVKIKIVETFIRGGKLVLVDEQGKEHYSPLI